MARKSQDNPIDTKYASLSSRLRAYRGPIIAGTAVLVLAGIAFLLWSQKKAAEYDETFRKGLAAWNEGKADRALVEWRKAAQMDPRDPELWVRIGRAELVSGQADRASEAWEEALRRQPGYRPALFERAKEALGRDVHRRVPPALDKSTGWLSIRLGPVGPEADRILADLREAAPHAPEFTKFARGAIFFLDGKYREAQPPLQEYSEPNGWDATALAIQGIAALYGALPDRAERALSAALTQRKEPLWLKVRAEAKYLQGNAEGARADYREAGLEKEAEPLFARRIPSRGLILWLRADAGVELSGASVSRWRDQSESHHDAVPKDPAQGPRVSASAVNKRPALLFSGGEDELRLPDGFEDFSAGLSLFTVGEPMTEPSDGWSYLFLATAARGAARIELLLGRRKESEQIVFAAEDLQAQTRSYVPALAPAKGFEGLCAIQEPSGAVRVYKRGLPLATGTLLLPRRIVRTRNRVGSGLKGQIAEVVLYNRSLSELERLGVEAHLKDRYFP